MKRPVLASAVVTVVYLIGGMIAGTGNSLIRTIASGQGKQFLIKTNTLSLIAFIQKKRFV